MNYIQLKDRLKKLNEEQLSKQVMVEDEYEDFYPATWSQTYNVLMARKYENDMSFTYRDLLELLNYMPKEELQKPVKFMTFEENIYRAKLYFYQVTDENNQLAQNTPYFCWR